MDVAIVIPVYNQWPLTAACLDSLRDAGIPASAIVVVDNASTDETAARLAERPQINVIRNQSNHGCGGAWNQGVRAFPATWTVLLNNDVVVPTGWLEGMLAFAESAGVDVVSPATCQGEQDYDIAGFARDYMRKMAGAKRVGIAYGFCFMVHQRVFEKAGLFDDDMKLGGYEDDEFFRRSRRAGFKLGVTGGSFLHHIGSATQIAMKAVRGAARAGLGDRAYYRKKYRLTWPRRQWWRWREKLQSALWRRNELSRYGVTLIADRKGGEFIWH